MKPVTTVALLLALCIGMLGQEKPASTKATTKKRVAASKLAANSVQTQLDEMKRALTEQQQQIRDLTQQLQQRDQSLQQAQQQASQAQATAASAQQAIAATAQKADEAQATVTSVKSDVSDLKMNATTAALALQDEQKRVTDMVESPLAIHFKGITATPGGFLAAETVWRQKAMASDVNTPFNSIPFAGADAGHISEFFGSGRPSRITMLLQGKISKAAFTGFYEMDWLSAGVTSNNNQSNSYTNRQRQLWGQVAMNNGWSFTGGQMWSLVTETKNGLDNRTEATPSVIDHAYHVGFSWARQYGFRVVKNFNNKLWLGFSIENAQSLVTTHGNASNFTFGALGTSGGLYNAFNGNYSYNVSPDYVLKLAWQPKYGHYEIVGLISPLRDRVYPNATATPATTVGAFNDTKIGGAVAANARWLFYNKHIELGVHAMGGDGNGRYGASGLPDAAVRPDGTLALLHAYQGLGTLEFHHPKFDVYFNGGSEYVSRYAQLLKPGSATQVGYGSLAFNNSGCLAEALPGAGGFASSGPGSCNNDTKSLFEFTSGFYIKFYNGPKGRVQWGPQYSYLRRSLWNGIGGAPNATENMFLTSFRYYLP